MTIILKKRLQPALLAFGLVAVALACSGGGGVITLKTGARTGLVVGAKAVAGDEDLVLITEKGVVNRVGVGDISKQGRATQGVKVMKVERRDRVAAMAVVREDKADVNN